MARPQVTMRLCTVSRDADGKPVLVSEGDGFTENQSAEAQARLLAARAEAQLKGLDPFTIVLLPDGKGGPYLPPV